MLNPNVETLRWSVLGDRSELRELPLSDAAVVETLVAHRVGNRALERRDVGDVLGAHLISDLEAHRTENREFLSRTKSVLRNLRENYLDSSNDIVLLKGFSNFALIDEPSALRETWDIDLVVSDPSAFMEALRNDGVEEYRNVSPHELMNADLDGVHIDLHDHYPIWTTSGDTGAVEIDSYRNGVVVQYHHGFLEVHKVRYSDLQPRRIKTDIFDCPSVFIADPALCALIVSAHTYRNYLSRSSVSVRNKTPLRFADLAEVVDLYRLAGFEWNPFFEYVDRFNAHASVFWIAKLISEYLDSTVLLEHCVNRYGEARVRVPSPISVWGGFWANLRYEPEQLFGRHLSTYDVVNRLGGRRIQTVSDGTIAFAVNVAEGLVNGLPEGAVVHGFRSALETFPLQTKMEFTTSHIDILISFKSTNQFENQRICIDIGGYAFESNYNRLRKAFTWKHSHLNTAARVSWDVVGDSYVARARFERGSCELLRNQDTSVLIGAGEFGGDHVMHGGTLVPFHLGLNDQVGH